MTIKIKKILITVCALMAILALALAFPLEYFKVDAATYSTPIPSGYYLDENYSILDITDGDITTSTKQVTLQKAMGDASVVRFKLTLTNACYWNTYFSVFTTSNYYTANENEGAFYVSIPRTSTYNTGSGAGVISTHIMSQTTRISGSPTSVTYPSWIDLNTQGNSYNVEMGAIKVYNSAGAVAGSLVYFEVDGQRLVEYYQNSDLPFSGDYFNFCMDVSTTGQKVNFSQSDLASIDASNATVTFSEDAYDCSDNAPAEPKPVVTLATTKSGVTYNKTVSPKYYDLTYADNDKSGTATATVTFKNKYSGTATKAFETIYAVDASKAVITLSGTLFKKSANDSPIKPVVVAVDLNGKAITQEHYTVSYENNVYPGTAKVLVTFKNGYVGTASTLFKIDSILGENHSVDENPVILDLAETYGGEQKKIELTSANGVESGLASAIYQMNDAEVVRFKMTADQNAWAQYFALHCGSTYYKGIAKGKGVANFVLGKSSDAKYHQKLRFDIGAGTGDDVGVPFTNLYVRDLDFGVDIANASGISVNVEVGSVKVYYTEDGETSYVGRQFYIEFDGVRVVEYVYFNDSLPFEGGNFFIGGNTSKIVIEPYELDEDEGEGQNQALSFSPNIPLTNNVSGGGSTDIVLDEQALSDKNYFVITTVLVISFTIVAAAYIKIIKEKK